MEAVQSPEHYGLDLKSSFTTGESTLWCDCSSDQPSRFKTTAKLLTFLRPTTPPTPKTIAVDAPLTFAAADLFTNREVIEDDISTLANVEGWRDVNCWTTRPWEKFVRQALLNDISLKNWLWQEKTRKDNRVRKVPVINVNGYGGLDLSIRGLWLRRLLKALGYRLTDTCCDDRLQLIEVHPALALALWWQDTRTDLFPNYKSDWPNSVTPLVTMLKELDDGTPHTFDDEDALDCFVAWRIAWLFHANKTVTLGCVRDGFVIVPSTDLAVELSEQCRKDKAAMETALLTSPVNVVPLSPLFATLHAITGRAVPQGSWKASSIVQAFPLWSGEATIRIAVARSDQRRRKVSGPMPHGRSDSSGVGAQGWAAVQRYCLASLP
jgi:hypothetical protein